VLEVYAHRAPKGWFRAWCDGSSTTDAGGRRAGIGVVLMDAQHEVIAALGEPAGALPPLSAEPAALEATVKTAVAGAQATCVCTPIALGSFTFGRIGTMTTPCPA
jgi:hypothetical protein